MRFVCSTLAVHALQLKQYYSQVIITDYTPIIIRMDGRTFETGFIRSTLSKRQPNEMNLN